MLCGVFKNYFLVSLLRNIMRGAWVAQLAKCLPSAQVMIPGFSDGDAVRFPAQQEACFSSPSQISPSLSKL